MFLHILAHHVKNRVIKFCFGRSGETVHRHFHNVLKSIIHLHHEFLTAPTPVIDDCNDDKWRSFKGCLGTIDGTFINVRVPSSSTSRYRTRKGHVATNVLAACTPDSQFIYVLSGWEGSAVDGHVLRDAMSRPNGLKVPLGNFINS